MKKKKGFTTVEVIGTLIIFGVILLVAVPSVFKLMEYFRNDYYDKLEDSITQAGIDFFESNPSYKPLGISEYNKVSLDFLSGENYIDKVVDFNGDACNDSYVIAIYKGNGKYEYHTCLKCSGDNYDGISGKDYCYSGPVESKEKLGIVGEIYMYYNLPLENIKQKLVKDIYIAKYDENGNFLSKIPNTDTTLLPVNIEDINITPDITNENNFKLYNLTYKDYEYQNVSVSVYKNKAPIVKLTSNGALYEEMKDVSLVTATLSVDSSDGFYGLTNTNASKYQIYKNNKWEDISCASVDNCTYDITESGTYKFRIVTNEGNVSFETKDYNVVIDAKKTYIINFDGNGATSGATSSKVCNYDEDCLLPANGFKKDDHVFIGWTYNKNSYSDKATVKFAVTGTITFVAQWKTEAQNFCDLLLADPDNIIYKQMFGNYKGSTTGILDGKKILNYASWTTTINSWECYDDDIICNRHTGYERVCVGDLCGKYKGMLAKDIRLLPEIEAITDCYGQISRFWCSCSAADYEPF